MKARRSSTNWMSASLACGALFACAGAAAGGVPGPRGNTLVQTYGRLPLGFEANRGQTDARVRFLARGPGYTLFLTPEEVVLALRTGGEVRGGPLGTSVVRMRAVGANPAPLLTSAETLPGASYYLVGNDPTKWRREIPAYAKVEYRNLYPGVNLVYHGRQGQLEYDFLVAAGADPRAILLAFEGVGRLAIDSRGDLVLDTGPGEIRMHKPVAYQEHDGARSAVESRFVIKEGHIGFEVGAYDQTRPLVIDPVLTYSTYLGGAGQDVAWDVTVDALGNA
jgi:hypothetical protein